MKLNFYKKNPKRILGYIMAFAILCLNYNTANAQCINTSQYGSAVLPGPTATGPTTISTCNYQTEYSPLSGAVVGYTYTCENVTNGRYITMTQGSPTGTVVNHGPSPLTWTAGVAGTYYVHWTVNSSCVTATGCQTTQVSFVTSSTNLVWGCTDSLALNFDTTATVNDGSCLYYMGCMDTLALNYDSLAVQDDGSCIYPCVAGYQEESFENGLTGTIWENDASNNPSYGWLNGNYGTGSTGTGPSAAFDSTDYMYVETSGNYGNHSYLNSRCVDLSAYTDPALVFAYHMYGATMGTLSVDISLDTGATWTSLWSLSGDQGDQWTETVVSLSSYSGSVYVRFDFLSGSSYTSDCALDLVRFMESPNAGCMDPFASNYDSTATMNDNSCLYPGCTDIYATNYCSSCNVNDSLSCVYPTCNTLDICDDFESASLSTNGWVTNSGTLSSVSLNSANAIIDTVSLQFTGGNTFYSTQYTEAAAFSNPDHLSSATICLDLSGSSAVDLSFSAELGGTGIDRAWFRVKVEGSVIADKNGITAFSSSTVSSGLNLYEYDLSAYAGNSSVHVTFESMCNHNVNYNTTNADYVWIDNVCLFEVFPCTYYAVNTTSTDVTCNAGADGSVSAAVIGMDTNLTYNNSYVWTDTSGTVVGTTASVSGLAAGTYTCIASDSINGCSASSSITISEPTPIAFTAVVTTSTTPTQSNGSVDITVAGGTPCATSVQVGSGTVSSYLHRLWYTYYMDGRSEVTYLDTELAALGMVPGDIIDEFGWKILSQDGSASTWPMNGANLSINGTNVWSGTHQAVVGLNNFVLTTPYVYTGGHLVVEWCFDNTAYISGNNYFECTSVPASVISRYQDGATGCALTGLVNYDPNRPNAYIGFASASGYTFSWSTGDTTEDISGLSAGGYCVTVTDCNGCTTTACDSVGVSATLGCMDPLACNYNPVANTDDSSCTYPGCTDTLACNYDSLAGCDDGSCTLPVPGYDCNGNCLAANACLCSSSCNSAFTNVNDEHITNVTFAGINNTSAGIVGGPVDYTSIAGATVTQGNTDNISVTLFNPTGYTEYIHSWFDWNQNGSFADSGEYYLVAGPVNDVGPYTNSISIPANATLGTTRMRVMCIYFNSVPDPCISATYGEAEDYCVTVLGGVSGCTDSTATNYNALANIDDGSCTYACIEGCMDSTAFNYDPLATCDSTNGAICTPILYGCTDSMAINYNSTVNTDDGSCLYYGCTDPSATNYDASAVVGCDASGSTSCCTYSANCGAITGVYISDVIHKRAVFNWDNMNSSTCQVDQIRIRYRAVGTSSWLTKTMGAPVGSGCNTSNTSKLVRFLIPSTQYEYEFKIWYCNSSTVAWHSYGTFTTAPDCENAINVTAIPLNTTKTEFCWDSVTTYSFVRLKYREDVPGSTFSSIGGFGVFSPTLCKEKNGLTPGLNYRVMWKTYCSPNGGPYRGPQWDGPVLWTQPTSVRISDSNESSLLKVVDILGREVNPNKVIDNTTLFYIYNDGTVEKKIIIE